MKARQIGWVLVADDEPEDPRAGREIVGLNSPEPPRVMLTVARLVPDAHDALPADEFEERIARYQKLVAEQRSLPLFGCDAGESVSAEAKMTGAQHQCWACGVIETRKGYIVAQQRACSPKFAEPSARRRAEAVALAKAESASRWHHRPYGKAGETSTETYCPKCFAVWGWPDEFDAIIDAVEGVAEILNEVAFRTSSEFSIV